MKQLKLLITMGVINGMSLEISGKYVLDPSSPAATAEESSYNRSEPSFLL
jgi:hypothetical protein